MEIAVQNISGKETGRKIVLSDSIYGIEANEHAIYLDVKQFMACQRSGTHKSKERAEVSRTTKKFKKQKGTGGARAGSLKSPLFKGGGTAFGPRPRLYWFKLNKKLKRLARKSALSTKAKNQEIIVVESFNLESPKTKEYLQILKSLKIDNKKSLLVMSETNKNVYLSARNLPRVKVITTSEINTYDILNANSLIISEDAIEKIENILS